MTYYECIKDVLMHGKSFSQGNYCAVTDKNVTKVFMFGHKVFEYNQKNGKFKYDFCGHESYPKTTRCINYCLDAVNAEFRVHTSKGNVSEKLVLNG